MVQLLIVDITIITYLAGKCKPAGGLFKQERLAFLPALEVSEPSTVFHMDRDVMPSFC